MAEDRVEYQHCVVGFLDLLGFRALVDGGRAKEALTALSEVRARQLKMDARSQYGLRISMFSDCVLISAPLEGPHNWQAVVVPQYCLDVYRTLLAKGITSRGGIAIGDLYHESPIVFGPALNEAYALEQTAVYPRLIMSDEAKALYTEAEPRIREKRLAVERFLSRDKDGRWYMRMFDPIFSIGFPKSSGILRDTYFKPFREIVEAQLRDTNDPKISQKLTWLLAEISIDQREFGHETFKVGKEN